MTAARTPFEEFLHRGIEAGGFGTDDVLAALLPLFEEVILAHERGLVAPLEGVAPLAVEDGRVKFDPTLAREPRKNPRRVEALQKPVSTALEVIHQSRQTTDVDAGLIEHKDLSVAAAGAEIVRPVFLPGYVTWEHRVEHHDQLTDVFSLGLLLASLACALDFSDPEDLDLFVRNRANLFALNPHLHPVVAGMVLQMTELNRHRRIQTVDAVVQRLRRYRDQTADYAVDFSRLKGFRESAPTERGKIILTHLRNRLFEISRRNRLIHFRPTLQTLNLTLASVPLMLDHRNIKPSQLFLWHDDIARALASGDSLVLGKYVRFEDAPYASGVLDQIIVTERRDRQEFGFAQLRLVICFLRWHNLKETPEERINSPLLLLPVELTRKKGVRDAYVLKPLSSEAEVNPALRHHLRQLYGLNLPEKVDLAETTLEAFHALLAEQIRVSEPGVTLTKIDRPQIELIHERARQRLDQFRRRQRFAARGARRFESFDYSYDRTRFRPLGLQLFHAQIKPARAPFAEVTGKPPAPRPLGIVAPADPASATPASAPSPVSEREQQLYAVRESRESGNPYQWEFDLCSQTLGNFNYRKMSLVQDYAALLEQDLPGPAFESIFSLQPKAAQADATATLPLREQFPVVECDPTQTLAVARARSGTSYIIQGPPGTGKSQTITNLIADYVARGKRVLFVCEKRAAIDVVFHRLGRQGLDELCCLIHDSQTDKREFIRNLKQTYDAFLNQPVDETLESRRDDLLRRMEVELAALQRWTDALEQNVAQCSVTVRDLLARLVELRSHQVELDPVAFEQVPAYAAWQPHAEIIKSLLAGLKRISGSKSLAEHSFRHLTENALTASHPLAAITAAVNESEQLLAKITAAFEALGESVKAESLGDIEAVVAYADELLPAALADALDLLNLRGTRARKLGKLVKEWRVAEKTLEKARAATTGWRKKLSPPDTVAALTQAKQSEASFFKWLSPAFWRLRALMHASYDASGHALAPRWSQVLQDLEFEHAAAAENERLRGGMTAAFGELDVDEGVQLLEVTPARVDGLPRAARGLHDYLLENTEATYVVENLAALKSVVARLRECLGLVVADYAALSPAVLARELKQLRADVVWLPDVLPLLGEVLRLPAELQRALRRLPLSETQLEAAMARKSLTGVYQDDRAFEATDGRVVARRVARLQSGHREWLGLNARWLHQQVRREFLRKVRLSTTPAAQLGAEEKELKRVYATGRRELEHEFSKTMRHRSIRDLADGETGVVLRDLKPVWLMSPLSVSDTLPLAVDAFDVVIFDEASQILVEEAVPAVYRAQQVIVVGDEMQLPPTNFFSASRSEEEPLLESEEASAAIQDLDADSFLTQSARNLPSTMLGWHYRSRSESLISFSNHAFYEGRLLTVPDRQPPGTARPVIEVRAERTTGDVDALLARAISFHFHPEAVYERRTNAMEAETIALLVRELLMRNTGMSLGVVAFSEAQQGEIESALTRLGADDATFRNRLEAEYEREEQGQFCGLFVKNLENVQGDERDIILLSVCYGYDRNRRMLMNFGPINQRGGEKRLNVIFSRARRHMAVVSSIRHFDITNDYNDGANCLRNFLEYAAACSGGDGATSRRVLHGANPLGVSRAAVERTGDPAVRQLAAALREAGFFVETEVGQSTFRVTLALRREEAGDHVLGVLLDDGAHYAQPNLLERYLLRPGVLQAFGWGVVQVFTKDWLQDRDAVLRQIDEAFESVENGSAVAAEVTYDAGEEMSELALAAEDASPYGALTSQTEDAPSIPPQAKRSAKPVSADESPVATPVTRYFTCIEDGASKFWETALAGVALTVRFGRIGTKGQSQTKTFATADAAHREQEKMIRSKQSKGYVETTAPAA